MLQNIPQHRRWSKMRLSTRHKERTGRCRPLTYTSPSALRRTRFGLIDVHDVRGDMHTIDVHDSDNMRLRGAINVHDGELGAALSTNGNSSGDGGNDGKASESSSHTSSY